MARPGDRGRVAVGSVRKMRSVLEQPPKAALILIAEPFQVVGAQLVDHDQHHQLRRVDGHGGPECRHERNHQQQGQTAEPLLARAHARSEPDTATASCSSARASWACDSSTFTITLPIGC